MNTPLTVLTIQREINPIERNTQINEKKPAPKKKNPEPSCCKFLTTHPQPPRIQLTSPLNFKFLTTSANFSQMKLKTKQLQLYIPLSWSFFDP